MPSPTQTEEVIPIGAPQEKYPRFWFRVFEIFPGACIWTAIIAPFVLSVKYPLAVAVFIIMFDVYWLMNSLSYGRTLVVGYLRLKKVMGTDWMKELKLLEKTSDEELKEKKWLKWQDIYHAVILATYKEDPKVLEASIQSVVDADYPNDKIIFILATEERDSTAPQVAKALEEKFGHHFYKFLITVHPDGIAGEIKAKGANATWAAKELIKFIEDKNIDPSNIIVSTEDADSRVSEKYFARLTHAYVTTPDRIHCGYQPIIMFFNNIWETPMISRVLAFGTTFWQLIQSVREYRLVTFSTHAMSLKTLQDMNFWCTSIVNEDSRQFYRAFFKYEGKFRSVPLFIPVYMDAVNVGVFKNTLKNLYLQQQRWAYGVEHFPYIVLESFRHRRIPILDKLSLIWRVWQGSFSWATTSFFITVVGWLPILLNNSFRDDVIASNFPIVTKVLLSLTWVGLIVSSTITLAILPQKPTHKGKYYLLTMVFQWLLVPITTLAFGALPGIDAQTRLMLGKYMGFRVTEKKIV